MSLQRILVISPNWIGDAVMAQPLLQLLHRQHPATPIDVLAPSWVAPAWRAMREVDTVLEAPFRHGALQLRERWNYARALKRRNYASAYVLPNTLKFALIPWLAGIPRRVGYVGEKRYGLLNVLHRDDADPCPMVSFYAALANSPDDVGRLPEELPKPVLTVESERMHATLEKFGIFPDRPLIAFAPGAEFGSAKRWPAEQFAELANMVQQAMPRAQVILLGSGKDKPVCDEIAAITPGTRSLAGVTTLDDAIALIARADGMVSNDSGLLHIASALNRPIIAIYGPTHPDHAPPFSDKAESIWLKLECAPCRQRECPLGHHRCMRDVSPAMIWKKLQVLLETDLTMKAGHHG